MYLFFAFGMFIDDFCMKQEARFRKRAEYLKEYARSLLEKKEDASESMELVDTLQRLGLSYLFENEIKTVLQNKHIDKTKENDLHYTALKFRILRQHGFFVPQGTRVPLAHITIYIRSI